VLILDARAPPQSRFRTARVVGGLCAAVCRKITALQHQSSLLRVWTFCPSPISWAPHNRRMYLNNHLTLRFDSGQFFSGRRAKAAVPAGGDCTGRLWTFLTIFVAVSASLYKFPTRRRARRLIQRRPPRKALVTRPERSVLHGWSRPAPRQSVVSSGT